MPALVLVTAGPGGYRTFWTLFGTSNQLLAALTLLVPQVANAVVAVLLFVLTLFLVVEAWKAVRPATAAPAAPARAA